MKRSHQVAKPVSPLILALLVACTTISHQRVEGWPELKVTVHEVNYFQVLKHCYTSVSLVWRVMGALPMACAWIDLAAKTCDIYIGTGDNDPSILEHELAHCAGGEHVGSTQLADYLKAHREIK